MMPVYEKIVDLINDVCERHLNSEYRDLARAMTAALQEAPEPTHLWTAANVGVRYHLCAR